TNQKDMQLMLNAAFEHSRRWRYEIHPAKCNFLTFNDMVTDSSVKGHVVLKIGDTRIPKVNFTVHVGIPISSKNDISQYVNDRCTSGKRKFCSLLGLGHKTGGLSPLTASKLYWAFSIPTMLFGAPVINYQASDVEKLELTHREIGKRIQFFPKTSANPSATMPLGWLSIDGYITVLQMMYLWSLLRFNNIYRDITITRLVKMFHVTYDNHADIFSPIRRIFLKTKMLGIENLVKNALDSGYLPSKRSWRLQIVNAVRSVEVKQFFLQCSCYGKLLYLRDYVTDLKPCIWWLICQKYPKCQSQCKTMMQLICNAHVLNTNNFNGSKRCILCNLCETETIEHFILRCPMYEPYRHNIFEALGCRGDSMGVIMKKVLGLSDVSCETLIIVSSCVHKMYNHRANLLALLDT
ncbi:unnamed protein product, partial [Owenia fusiformis]